MSRWRVFLSATALAAVFTGAAVWAQSPMAVQWGCDAPAGRVCYFSIHFVSGGVRNFSLNAGRKTMLGGLTPGADQYFVSIDAPNYGDDNRCRQLIAMGRSCQRKIVDPGYND